MKAVVDGKVYYIEFRYGKTEPDLLIVWGHSDSEEFTRDSRRHFENAMIAGHRAYEVDTKRSEGGYVARGRRIHCWTPDLGAALIAYGQDQTTCLIRDASTPSPGDGITFPVIAEATVTRDPKDNENREEARRVALMRVVDHWFPGVQGKSARRAFWEAYEGRKQGCAGVRGEQIAYPAYAAPLALNEPFTL